MIFNSVSFLIFFPIVLLLYFALPKRIKNGWLLIASYYFYMNWNPRYGLLLLTCTAVTYIGSRLVEAQKKKSRAEAAKRVLLAALIVIFGLLFYFKYVNFLLDTLENLLRLFGLGFSLPNFDIVLPVGISFFTFQAAGYLIDVYRGDIYAEKNFFRYALFVSFFPQLVAGPIERSRNLLKQLDRTYTFVFARAREGLYLMLWGYFMKMVIADRAALLVDQVYNHLGEHNGAAVLLASVLFAFQIYGDFGGYSLIAIGASRILGIRLMCNFDSPYFACSCSEFWRRWHISLNTWFRDYLYIPLGGNRHGTFRKYLNLLIVFLVSGLWHGARWNFVLWGAINGLYQIVGSLLEPVRRKLFPVLGIRREVSSHRWLQRILTFVLIDVSWILFRVNQVADLGTIGQLLTKKMEPWTLFSSTLFTWGLSKADLIILFAAIFLLLLVDGLRLVQFSWKEWYFEQGVWLRTLVFTGLILIILVFGVWGNAYDAQSFIYFQF